MSLLRTKRLFTGAAVALTAGVLVSACGSSSPSSSGASSTSAASTTIDGSKAFTASCSQLRSKYSGLPSQITIGTEADSPPDEYVNKNDPSDIIGFEPDTIAVLADCLGFKYTYSNQGFNNVIEAVESGRDPIGIAAVYITATREKTLDFVSYYSSEEQATVQPALASKITNVMSFCGMSTGAFTGSVELTYLTQLSSKCVKAGKPKIDINVYQDASTITLSLADKRIDFVLGAQADTARAMAAYPGKISGSIIVKPLSFDIGIAVSKHDTELGEALAAAMQAMQANDLEGPLLKKNGYDASIQVPAKLIQ